MTGTAMASGTVSVRTLRKLRESARCLVFGVTLLISVAAAQVLGAAGWKRLDTPAFTVIGNVSARELRSAAADFEGFRQVLGRVIGQRSAATATPTVVFVFASDRDFTPFKPLYRGKPGDMAGVFVPDLDIGFVAMIAGRDAYARRVLFHEYTHAVVAEWMPNAPPWLNEGLAEYYSTFEMGSDGRQATIGIPIEAHVRLLRETTWLPIPALLSAGHDSPTYHERDRRSVFYAESWALMHLIQTDPSLREPFGAYMAAASTGAEPADAWRQAFGSRMEEKLRSYLARFAFVSRRYEFKAPVVVASATPSPMSEADAQAMLAEFLIAQRRFDDADARLSAVNASDRVNPSVAVTIARLASARGDVESASRTFSALPDVQDWLTAYQAATGMARLLERSFGAARVSPDAARGYLERVVRDRGAFANALATRVSLGLSAGPGAIPGAVEDIERARVLAPGRRDYAILRSLVLDRQRTVAARTETVHFPAPAEFRPALRPLRNGESSFEGTLERIDCSAAGVVFHIHVVGRDIEVRARSMPEVDFISYRNDLQGYVPCGPLKDPPPVRVTWRHGSPSGTKLAVAIEYLPVPGR